MEISQMPALERLGSLIKNKSSRVVAWTGAGLSRPAKLPDWRGLMKSLLRIGFSKLDEIAEDKRTASLLNLAESESDLWSAFSHLKEALGPTTFTESIRLQLQNADKCEIPENYKRLWRLGIDGIITLNLDPLSRRSYSAEFPGGARDFSFTGFDAGSFSHVLNSLNTNKFICNLHGDIGNANSWVLTREQLKALKADPGCNAFLHTCLISRTMLFVGVSADDPAISQHLSHLKASGCDFSPHFWLTDRHDSKTIDFAEKNGIQTISYTPDETHTNLAKILESLIGFVPEEKRPTIIPPSQFTPAHIPEIISDEQLRLQEPNAIRKYLNQRAINIIAQTPVSRLEAYQKFLSDYDSSIYNAWYVPKGKESMFFDFKIVSLISSEGAFGQVFMAERGGVTYAIKLIHQKIRENAEMMTSFRRGVESMEIISKSDQLKGKIVKYEGAWEIPAAVAMEYVDGLNLEEAVNSRMVSTWAQVIDIALQLATGIRTAHRLSVLHRDVRPPNIMLRGFVSADDPIDVVILDFDLSWHRDATGESLQLGNTSNCYLAPEQLDPIAKKVTRNSLVDSYGFGMTLYFLTHLESPRINAHLTAEWSDAVIPKGQFRKCAEWMSIPRRIGRLIEYCTRHDQERRSDMTSIEGELLNLKNALIHDVLPSDPIYLIEEIASRAPSMDGRYSLNFDDCEVYFETTSGISVRLGLSGSREDLSVRIGWSNRGQGNYANVKKYIEPRSQQIADSLLKKKWVILGRKLDASTVFIDAARPLSSVKAGGDLTQIASTIEECVKIMLQVAAL